MNELINYLILGVVQGVTEFFPISSSGHLVLFEDFLGIKIMEDGNLLNVFINKEGGRKATALFIDDLERLNLILFCVHHFLQLLC